MHKFLRRRGALAACTLALAIFFVPLASSGQDTDELEDWQRDELRGLVEIITDARSGELVQLENPFTLETDFLKGMENLTYIPYTVTIDPSRLTQSSVAAYLWVEEQLEGDEERDDDEEPAFEDVYFVDVSDSRSDGGPISLSRAFTAEGGTYDVYLAIRDSHGEDGDPDDSSILMIKQEVEVPDYWNDELQTSSVIVAQSVEPLAQPLSEEQQAAEPYTLGTTRITPKQGTTFEKSDELSLIFLVYNPELDSDGVPNLTIEYDFHQRAEGVEEFFNMTNPQEFNSRTLPPGFDMAAGHQIVAGQSVPLGGFPAGDFRLEITVTDNEAGDSLVRDVNFNVTD